MDACPPVVIPSSMKLHTEPVAALVRLNPPLAQEVVNALNKIDRSRNYFYRQVVGDVPVKMRCV